MRRWMSGSSGSQPNTPSAVAMTAKIGTPASTISADAGELPRDAAGDGDREP